MARLARAVFPGIPHHVTQRGNGRAQTLFSDNDYAAYGELMARTREWPGLQARQARVQAEGRLRRK